MKGCLVFILCVAFPPIIPFVIVYYLIVIANRK